MSCIVRLLSFLPCFLLILLSDIPRFLSSLPTLRAFSFCCRLLSFPLSANSLFFAGLFFFFFNVFAFVVFPSPVFAAQILAATFSRSSAVKIPGVTFGKTRAVVSDRELSLSFSLGPAWLGSA